MTEVSNIMLGISFFGADLRETLDTLKHFADDLGPGNDISLGLETGLKRDDPQIEDLLTVVRQQSWPNIYLWHHKTTKKVSRSFPADYPQPFYEKTSYGGDFNHLIAVAADKGYSYVVRLDPGTYPAGRKGRFRSLVTSHVHQLTHHNQSVCSGQYTGRIGLRDHFVNLGTADALYELVERYTGINPRQVMQVTGGAALTVAVSGPPAIPFNGVRVWGSDDGFVQLASPPSRPLADNKIGRDDPGSSAASLVDYCARLGSMVVLREISLGASKPEALIKGTEFLELLNNQIDPTKIPDHDRQNTLNYANPAEMSALLQHLKNQAVRRLQNRSAAILAGYQNYERLGKEWEHIVQVTARSAHPWIDEVK